MNQVAMCECCGRKPVAGYVQRWGVYIERFCLKCWQKGGAGAASKHKPATATGRVPMVAR